MHVAIILLTIFSCAFSQLWNQLPGHAVQISAKGNELWAITPTGQIVRWTGSKWGNVWLPGAATSVAPCADGRAWITSNADDDQQASSPCKGKDCVFRWNSSTNKWDYLAAWAKSISATSAENAYIVGIDACVSKYIPQSGTWTNLNASDNCNSYQISLGEDNELWKLDQNSFLYRYAFGGWQKQDVPAVMALPNYVNVQSSGRVVVTDDDMYVWLWNGKQWQKIASGGSVNPTCEQATINNQSIFCVDRRNRIYKIDA
jgi:hypothetical protein